MMYIVWAVIFCLVVLTIHLGSNDLRGLNQEVLDTLQLSASETDDDDESEGAFADVEAYNKVGKRQTVVGMVSVVCLLYMYNFTPWHSYIGNVVSFIVNGIITWSMLLFTVEGLFMWNSSQSQV